MESHHHFSGLVAFLFFKTVIFIRVIFCLLTKLLMAFNKADLLYTNYSWTKYDVNAPEISGRPDETVFSRMEGSEMLYMINTFDWAGLPPTYEQGRKIERMIHDHLPSTVYTQKEVRKWIIENWRKVD